MKKYVFAIFVSIASFLMVSCDSGSSSNDGDNPRNPLSPNNIGENEFVCDVEFNGGNLRQVANIPGECEGFSEVVDKGDGSSVITTEMSIYGKSDAEYREVCDSLSEMSGEFIPGSYQCKNGYFKFKILVDNNKINLDEIARNARKECEQNRLEYEEKLKSSNPMLSSSSKRNSNSSSSVSSLQNSVTCDVSMEGDKVVLRATLNQFGFVESVVSKYEQIGLDWHVSAVFLFDGIAAESNANEMCQEMRDVLGNDALSFSCDAQSVSYVVDLEDEYSKVNDIVSLLQDECDEMKSSYNGYDFDGPREAPDEIPMSCNVTESGNSMTLNLVYSSWSYTSTVVIEGEKIHETEKFYGDYGDYADLMCVSDKADFENENVVCNGAEIQLDSNGDGISKDEMKQISQMMCDAFMDGSMSFDDMLE